MADLAKVKRNVSRMIDMGAPESDIDAYISEEGTTVDAVRSFKAGTGGMAADDPRRGFIEQAKRNVSEGQFPDASSSHPEFAPPTPQYGGIGINATAGTNAGIYGTLGAPVDLMRGAMNLGIRGVNAATGSEIGMIPEDSFGGSRSIAQAMGAINPALDPANTAATTTGERVARGIGEGVGYTLAPEAALAGAARVGAVTPRVGEMAGKMLGRSETAGQLAANSVVGGASGAGASAAMEAAPDEWKPLAGMAGGLVGGGFGVAATASPALARAGAGVVSDIAAPLTAGGRQRLAGQTLRDAASDPEALRRSLDAGSTDLVPGSKPTTFQQTGDMGIGAIERGAAARNPEAFNARRADQNAARVSTIGKLQETGAPEAVAGAIRNRLQAIDDATGDIVSRATQGTRKAGGLLGGGISPDEAGASARGSLEAARAGAKEQERALWSAVDPDGSLVASTTKVRDEAKRALNGRPASERAPEGEEAAILETLSRYGDAAPFNEIAAMRSRLSDALRTERQTNGESRAYQRLSRLRGAIEDDLSQAASGKVAKEAEAIAAGQLDPATSTAARLEAVAAPKVSRKVFTPSGKAVDVDYELVEAGDLIASTLPDGRPNPRYPAALQPRDRTRAASDTQVASIAKNLQPERLGPSADAATGAPIVGPDNVVESGNGRVAGIARAYGDNGPSSAAYRDYLKREGYAVDGMKNPVLVRRRLGEMSEADRVRFTQEANASQSMALSASEQAATDATRLSPSILKLYRGGDVSSAENRDFAKAFLGAVADKGQEGAFVTGKGSLSLDGATRMRTALLSSAYDDGRLVAALADEGDDNIRAFGKAMTDIAGDVARLRAGIKAGEIEAKADIAPALTEAARLVQSARSSGRRLPDLIAQQDAFNPVSQPALKVLQMAYGDNLAGRLSRDKLTTIMRQAVDEAEQQTSGSRLFGEALDASTILDGVKRRYGSAASSETYAGGSSALSGNGEVRPGARGSGNLPDGASGLEGNRTGGTGSGQGSGAVDGRILDRPELTPNFDPAALDRLKGASAATRNRAETFDNKTLAPLRKRPSSTAPYELPDSQVAARIFFPQAKSFDAIQTYRKAVGDGPALESLQGYAVDRLRKVALNDDGTFDGAKLARWREAHADALRAMPALRDRLSTVEKATKTLDTVTRARKTALDAAQRGSLSKFLNLEDPTDVTRTVGGIFSRQDAAGQMLKLRAALGKDEAAKQGLRKAIVDHITGKFVGNTEAATSGIGTVKADGFQTFVRQNANALRAAGFSADELETMGRVAADLQRANRSIAAVKLPGGSNTTQDLLQVQKGDAAPTLLSKLAIGLVAGGGAVGGGGIGAALGAMGAQMVGNLRRAGIETVNDLVADALLDPAKARLLLAQPGRKTQEATWKMLATLYRRSAAVSGAVSLSPDNDHSSPMRAAGAR